jgi:hypothetical protein
VALFAPCRVIWVLEEALPEAGVPETIGVSAGIVPDAAGVSAMVVPDVAGVLAIVVPDVAGVLAVVVLEVAGVFIRPELLVGAVVGAPDELGDWAPADDEQAARAILAIRNKLNNIIDLDFLANILFLHTFKVSVFNH